MGRDPLKRRDLLREQLAYDAARVIAEDGVDDYAVARRKAVKRMGAGDVRHHLPSDEDIEAALRSFRALFQQASHPPILHALRAEALAAMRKFEPFHPYLTGSVLSGTAGAHSDINLLLFSDDAKAVLLFLLKHQLEFEEGEWRLTLNGHEETVPSYTLTGESGTQIHVTVLPEKARYSGGRHADIAAVEALLAAERDDSFLPPA